MGHTVFVVLTDSLTDRREMINIGCFDPFHNRLPETTSVWVACSFPFFALPTGLGPWVWRICRVFVFMSESLADWRVSPLSKGVRSDHLPEITDQTDHYDVYSTVYTTQHWLSNVVPFKTRLACCNPVYSSASDLGFLGLHQLLTVRPRPFLMLTLLIAGSAV